MPSEFLNIINISASEQNFENSALFLANLFMMIMDKKLKFVHILSLNSNVWTKKSSNGINCLCSGKKKVLIKTQCKIFLSMKQPLRGVLVNSCFKNLLHDEIFQFDNKIQEKKITAQLQFNEIL